MKFLNADLDGLRAKVAGGVPILVSTHIHPDPDAIGSALAACEILRQLGGKPQIVLQDVVPPRCLILPGADEIISLAQIPADTRFQIAVVVDSGSLSRVGDVENLLSPDAFLVNIDHHASNDAFGAINFVRRECAATAELLYLLGKELGIVLNKSLAENLFAGLVTDTGRFRYPNTTARTFRIASDLVEAGADVTKITNGMYFDLPMTDLLSTAAIFSTLELFGGGQVSTMFVRLEYRVEDPDNIVDLAVSIRGVKAAALLSETPEGKIRISLRSRCDANMAKIAESFGGGGHEKAAGFRMMGSLESVREKLLPVLLRAVDDADHKNHNGAIQRLPD